MLIFKTDTFVISENDSVCKVMYKKIVLIFHDISMTKGLCYLWRLYIGWFFELNANKLTC